MKRILVISVLISFLFSQQDHFMLGVWPGNNCIDPGCAEVDFSLFTPSLKYNQNVISITTGEKTLPQLI